MSRGASDDTISSSSVDEKCVTKKKKIFPPLAIVNTYDNSFLAELRAIREFIPNRNTIGKFHEVPKDTSITIRFKCPLFYFFVWRNCPTDNRICMTTPLMLSVNSFKLNLMLSEKKSWGKRCNGIDYKNKQYSSFSSRSVRLFPWGLQPSI